MRAEWTDWGEGKIGVRLKASSDELRQLSEAALVLSRDADQHFHITETGRVLSTVGDIEVSVMSGESPPSMAMTSFALPPGAEIRDPRARPAPGWPWARPVAAALLGLVGVVQTLSAFAAANVTIAGSDYRPMLTKGAWSAVTGVLAFQASALVARGWKARVLAFVGTLAAVDVTLALFERFGALLHWVP